MKIDPQIITIVEHLIIRNTDDGTIHLNQRCPKAKKKEDNNILKTDK